MPRVVLGIRLFPANPRGLYTLRLSRKASFDGALPIIGGCILERVARKKLMAQNQEDHLTTEHKSFYRIASDGARTDALFVVYRDLHHGDFVLQREQHHFRAEKAAKDRELRLDFREGVALDYAVGAADVCEAVRVEEHFHHFGYGVVSPLEEFPHIRTFPDEFLGGAGTEHEIEIRAVGEKFLYVPGVEGAVGFAHAEKIALCFDKATLNGGAVALASLDNFASPGASHFLARSLGGVIVDDHDFIHEARGEEVLDALADAVFFVIGGKDYGDTFIFPHT